MTASPVKKRVIRKRKPATGAAAAGNRKRRVAEISESGSESASALWSTTAESRSKKRKPPAAKVQTAKSRKVVVGRREEESDEDFDPGPAVRGRSARTVTKNYSEVFDAAKTSDYDELDEAEEEEANRRKKKEFDIMAPVEEEYIVEKVLEFEEGEKSGSPEEGELGNEEATEFNPDSVKYLIKWHRRSYRQCSWLPLEELRYYKGYKKVTNFVKRMKETMEYVGRDDVPAEEREDFLMQREQVREAVKGFQQLEKIIAERRNSLGGAEYLAKWSELPYADCTWESPNSLTWEKDQALIDEFLDRENEILTSANSYNPFSNKETRKPFKRMLEQPDFMQGEGRRLRDYQLEGLNWLAFSWVNNRNVILSDEMGLGKTLQTISCIGWMKHVKKVQGPYLIVVPLSTIAAWQREFARWLPDMNVIMYVGDGNSRDVIRRFEFFSERESPKFHCLLTTPELVLADSDYLIDGFRWALLAVDEAHRLKNEESSMNRTLRSFNSCNRLLITGTPLQNSIKELWALLNFLNPDIYSSSEAFEEKYNFSALRSPERISQLHAELRPYILRRQKSDVEKSLPSKTYAVLRVGLTSLQQKYYRWILTRNFSKLNAGRKGGSGGSTAMSLQNIVVELKKVCNHPFLLPNVEDLDTPDPVNNLIRSSGKLILLDKLLLRLKEKGHRVLVFSQMVRMLDILQDYCRMRAFAFQRLDGSMANDIRQKAVDHFNAPDSTDFIFLLSTRAGGLGINLATADTVIIFDSDWNPQNDLQAESRAHRIGQKKDVKVFRMLSRETVEEDILERAKRKRVLEHLVIHGVEGGDAPGKVTFKKEELSAILRFGAERLFEKAEEEEDGKPVEKVEKGMEMDDIDEILNRHPKDNGMEEEPGGSTGGSMGDSLLNAFKWADFATEEYDEKEAAASTQQQKEAEAAASMIKEKEMALKKKAEDAEKCLERDREMLSKENDSEFWGKLIPKTEQDGADVNELVYLGPRKSTKVKSYAEETGAESTKKEKTRRRGRNGTAAADTPLSRKEAVACVRSFKKFGSVDRIEEVLKDASLSDRISIPEAKKLFIEALDKARENMDAGATVTLSGETVNARDLVTRVDELEELRKRVLEYQVDTRFRLSKHSRRAAPARGTKWLPTSDAMLLVGIHRHGFGNWELIRRDPDLNLGDKITTQNKSNLVRRAANLLKSLVAEKSMSRGRKTDKTKRAPMVKSTSSRPQRSGRKKRLDWGEVLATEKDVMRELRKLSESDGDAGDQKRKIRRTKECLISIGNAIATASAPAEEGWKYVAVKCKTALNGAELARLFVKLNDSKRR